MCLMADLIADRPSPITPVPMKWSPYYVTAASVLCIFTGLLSFGKLSTQLKTLLIFLLITVVLEELLVLLARTPEEEYRWIRRLYILLRPFEYVIYSSVVLPAARFPKAGVYIRATALAFFCYVAYLFLAGGANQAAVSTTFILSGIGCIAASLVYFRSVMTSQAPVSLGRDPAFWIAAALLFFYTGNIIVTGLYPQLIRLSPDLAKSLYLAFNLSLGVIRYLLFIAAFVVCRKNTPENAGQ